MATSTRARWRFLAPIALLGLLAGSVLTGARPATPAHSPVTLTVWWNNWGATFDNLMVQATDSHSLWHKLYPNITVKWTFYANLQQKLLTAIAASTPPDMTYINALEGQAWAEKGVLTPLDNYSKAAHLEKRQFVLASFPPYEYNGHLYALLNSGNFLALLWNKDMFKAAGLPNHAPRTIQELEAYNARLFKFKNGRIVQAGLFTDFPPANLPLQTWGLQFGGQFVDRAHHKITANDPHIVAALQWMLDQSRKWGQVNEDRFVGSVAYGRETPTDPFYTGKVAMEWQGDWDFYTEAKYAPTLHVGVAALPTAGHGLRLWDDNNWATAIPKGSAHPTEAWQLMQYLTTGPEAPKVIADTINFLEYKPLVPAFFKETYRIMGSKNPMRQDFHVFQDTIMPNTIAQPYYDIPVASVYDDELARAVTNVLHGKDTPKHALDVVTQGVQHAWDTFTPVP
jgi:multiple sugar transport system substrate-binding protein